MFPLLVTMVINNFPYYAMLCIFCLLEMFTLFNVQKGHYFSYAAIAAALLSTLCLIGPF